MGQIVSVNLARPGTVRVRGHDSATGIFKEPVQRPVPVGPLGLERDIIVDTRFHGGTEKAVYVYAAEDYAWWETQLGRALPHGTFGENLTLRGVDLAQTRVGDVLAVGDVRLQATGPRTPCSTLGAKMLALGEKSFVKRFYDAGRLGVYFRVIKAGTLETGDAAAWESRAPEGALVAELGRKK